MGLSRVLVATDFSPHSSCALARALQLPLRKGAEILLVHALSAEASEKGRHEEQEALARHALEESVHHTQEARAQVACDVRGLLVWGIPAEALTQTARDFGAELVVLGRPRHPGSLLERMRERLAGGLIERIPTALLVVGPPPVCPYRRPLVAVDFTEASRRALETVLRLCPGASRVAVLHGYDTSYVLVLHQSAAQPSRIMEYLREAKARARTELQRFLVPYRDAGVHFDELVRSGEATACILEIAQQEQADLVAVGRHLRLGLGRIVRPHTAPQIARESSCDVLVLEAPLSGQSRP
ncbi:universal stress family protein [Cystobacter fuscus DSM 2262]|uniref:Universal stress family protein n=1 Tax=Cystobacter fuscus (strain ATCC 25194 / DSM 2262 / NBRC 100088 / M29) TaxID=1242864 RepID=S9PCM4_CYSF2|nr:universal stress family protein [Cystobacter fuscus DSM 2262]